MHLPRSASPLILLMVCGFALGGALIALLAPAGTLASPAEDTVQVGPNDSLIFSPASVSVPLSETVKWVWASASVPHSTTSGSCSGFTCTPDGQWDSGVQTAPFEFPHTFTTTGTYPYFCTIHGATMQGVVVVVEPRNFLPLIAR